MSNARSQLGRRVTQVAVLLVLAIIALMLVFYPSGESASSQTDEDSQTQNDKKKPKKPPEPDFFTRTPVLLPGIFQKEVKRTERIEDLLDEERLAAEFERSQQSAMKYNRAKAGHWYSVYYPVVANKSDVKAELETRGVLPTGKPLPVPQTNYHATIKRPAGLAKKEWKNLESSVFAPTRTENDGRAKSVNVECLLRQGNRVLSRASTVQPVLPMQPFQHHFVVLSDRPDKWSFLKVMDSFQLRGQLGDAEAMPAVYYMVSSVPGDPVPLSRNPLQWTTVAYVLWDNLSPDELDTDQQTALIDWLHHGGQLIVSGPDCLDQLQDGFLGPYLPARFDGSINLTADDVKTLNAHWSIRTRRGNDKRLLTIPPTQGIQGVRFAPHEDARFIDNTGEVVIERQIGRGRIVATSFSLTSPRIKRWRSFQSFFNGALLRKPARRFKKNRSLEDTFVWVDDKTSIYDPLMSSTVRYISRDLGNQGTASDTGLIEDDVVLASGAGFGMSMGSYAPNSQTDTPAPTSRNHKDHWHYGGYQDQPQAGVGGWNDFSGVAKAARRSLRDSAGITPPSGDFVLKMLGTYLVVLVPLNWLFFRLIGKVEYAWIAAPIIAITGAISVVRLASLDIGFVRSNTEVAVLEAFADHPRAHLTKYSALYTSLSTRYSADLDNPTSQALPFATRERQDWSPDNEPLTPVNLYRSVVTRLEDFQVQSNSTGLLHTESMLDLEGTFSLGPKSDFRTATLYNTSAVNLSAAGVLHRSDNANNTEKYTLAWIGDLAAGQSTELKFSPVAPKDWHQQWLSDPALASVTRRAGDIWRNNVTQQSNTASLEQILGFPELQDRLPEYQRVLNLLSVSREPGGWRFDEFRTAYTNVQNKAADGDSSISAGGLFDAVANNLTLSPGETRLIGVTQQPLGSDTLTPSATRTRRTALVVVHLSHPKLPPARADVNAQTDKSNLSDVDLEEENQLLEDSFDERIK